MKDQAQQEQVQQPVPHPRGRAAEVLRQCERFEWLIEDVRDQVATSPTEELRRTLQDPESRISELERALIILALKATPQAGKALWDWHAPPTPTRLGLLHQLALREWKNRQRGRDREEARGLGLAA